MNTAGSGDCIRSSAIIMKIIYYEVSGKVSFGDTRVNAKRIRAKAIKRNLFISYIKEYVTK